MRVKEYVVRQEIYSFEELSETAKENARLKYLEEFRESEIFSDGCLEYLKRVFPKSDLQIQYSLASCQGDGFNIYGSLNMFDIIEYLADKYYKNFSDSEFRLLRFLENNYEWCSFKLKHNNRYCYCVADQNDFEYDIVDWMESDGFYSGIDKQELTFAKIDSLIKKVLTDLCRDFEKGGYDYFYKVEDDSEIVDIWEANEYEGWDVNGNPIYS